MHVEERGGVFFETIGRKLDSLVHPVAKYGAWAAGLLVLLMSLLTCLDVLSRSTTNKPIPGVIELEQYMLALVVFLATAYTAVKDGHVAVDIFSRKYSPKTAVFIKSTGHIIFMFFAFMLAWYQLAKSVDAYKMNEAGLVTGIPLYPILGVTCLGSLLLALVILGKYMALQAEAFKNPGRPWLWICLPLTLALAFLFSPEMVKLFVEEIPPVQVGILVTLLLMVYLFAGFSIAVSIGFTGMLGIWYLQDFSSVGAILKMTTYGSVSTYLFTVLPLFVGMGLLAFAAGLSENLYQAFYRFFGGLRGSLAMATVVGSAGFAAICGDSMATAATMGSVSLPEMKKYRYSEALATGCLSAGGTLGILIPPSIGFIIYGMITEQSVGKLFMAGVLPGILLAALFCLMVWAWSAINPNAGPPGAKCSYGEKAQAMLRIWPILVMFVVVMGGLYAGIFTATEAGAVGLASAVILGLALKRFTKVGFFSALIETGMVTSMIFTVLIGVNVFNYFIASSEIAQGLAGFVAGLEMSRYWVLLVILIMYVILGMLMAIIPKMMLTLPLIFPIAVNLGFDPIWFGVIMVIVMEMGMITPPIGINVFIVAGVAKDVPMGTIFKGTIPFLVAMALVVLILTILPDIALILPNSMETLPPVGY